MNLTNDLLEISEPFGSVRDNHLQKAILRHIVLDQLHKLEVPAVPKDADDISLRAFESGELSFLKDLEFVHLFLKFFLEGLQQHGGCGDVPSGPLFDENRYSQRGIGMQDLDFVRSRRLDVHGRGILKREPSLCIRVPLESIGGARTMTLACEQAEHGCEDAPGGTGKSG
jgi:hypothetical protein